MIRRLQLTLTLLAAAHALIAQTVMPDGTPVRLRLNEPLSSGHNQVGQGISLSVTEDVVVGGKTIIESGAHATGMITIAEPKKRMGRGGKLDFVPEKVQLADGRMVSLRTTAQGFSGKGNGVKTGVLMAGIALFAWPVAPVALLIKGKDIEIPPGTTFTTFTDSKVIVNEPAAVAAVPQIDSSSAVRSASVAVSADAEGADIEVDGKPVGQTPATLNLNPGAHRIAVKRDAQTWERTVQLAAGNSISLKARLTPALSNANVIAESVR